MSAFIGALSLFDFPALSLKREALMFERIAVPSLSLNKSFQGSNYRHEWLEEQGILFDPGIPTGDTWLEDAETAKRDLLQCSDFVLMDYENPSKVLKPRMVDHFAFFQRYAGFIQSRAYARDLRKHGMDAYPICYFAGIPMAEATPCEKNDANVIQVVLKTLPMPDDTVPLEHILEYRSDPDSYSKFLALRNWMSDIGRANVPAIEIEQKIEYLLDQYQQHMRLHKIKTNMGTLETLVVSTAEFLEDLANKKFSKLAKALFSARQRKIKLLEAELSAPGREVAYILHVRHTFGAADELKDG